MHVSAHCGRASGRLERTFGSFQAGVLSYFEDWSDQKHSLVAFFARHPAMANRLRVVDPRGHVVDLLDPAGLPPTEPESASPA